jgi:hypothetical protein
MKWCGKKNISVISVYHTDERKAVAVRRKEIPKPVNMIAYSEHGVGGYIKVQLLQIK